MALRNPEERILHFIFSDFDQYSGTCSGIFDQLFSFLSHLRVAWDPYEPTARKRGVRGTCVESLDVNVRVNVVWGREKAQWRGGLEGAVKANVL